MRYTLLDLENVGGKKGKYLSKYEYYDKYFSHDDRTHT